MYAVSARITVKRGEWKMTRDVPTFYLDENVQGIISNVQAERIGRSIVDPFDAYEDVNVSAYWVS